MLDILYVRDGAAGAKAAILAGCTAIEHGSYVDDATLDLMAQRGAYFDPNFLVLHNYPDNRLSWSFPDATFQALEKALEPTASILRQARAHDGGGVLIVLCLARLTWSGYLTPI